MKFQISGFRPSEKSSSICAAKWRKRGVKRSETEREEIKWIFHFIVDNLVDKQITERAESNQEIILSRQLLMTGAIITSYMVLFNSCTLPGHCLFSQDSIMKCQCSNPYFLVEPYCPFEQPEPFCPRMNRIVCENYFLPDC